MNKVALKKIGFAEQNEIEDNWTEAQEQAEQQRSTSVTTDGTTWHWFDCIDQNNATLDEELVDESDGVYYTANLDFTVRTDLDMALAKKYARRPLVLKVQAVDGTIYTLGTKQYPVILTTTNRYSSLSTREVQVRGSYDTLTGIMQ